MESRTRYSEIFLKGACGFGTAFGALCLFSSIPLAAFAGVGGYLVAENKLSTAFIGECSKNIGQDVGQKLNMKFKAEIPAENKFIFNFVKKNIAYPLLDDYTKEFGKAITIVLDKLDRGIIKPESIVIQHYPPPSNGFTLSARLLKHEPTIVKLAETLNISGEEQKKLHVSNFNLVAEIDDSIQKQKWMLGFFGFSRGLAEQVVRHLEIDEVIKMDTNRMGR